MDRNELRSDRVAVVMSAPLPFNEGADYDTLRRRWLSKYARIQGQADTKIRTVLVDAASEAHDRIAVLAQKSTFSAGVRSAQIRLAIQQTRITLNDVFNAVLPIIKTGQGDEASAAVDGLTESDRRYLLAVFRDAPSVKYFVESQRQAARNGVAHAISSVTGADRPLSARVYRSKALANNWIKNTVTAAIVRGDSAADLAKAVRSSIRPTTPGGVSYAALRLGRTELNNAFHATAIEMSKDRPWIDGMRWHLSATHEWQGGDEPCERLSGRIFAIEHVPAKPHPQCRCFITPELEAFEVFERNLLAGNYREWTEKNAA